MRNLPIIIAFVCLGACAASCGRQGPFNALPAGSYSGVVLVTETGKVEGPTAEMVKALQHELDFYTKNELQFNVRVVPAHDFEKEIPAKNMVVFGIVNQGRIGGIIERFISDSGAKAVLEGRYSVFKKMDAPVMGQLTIIVTGVSADDLALAAREQGPVLRDILEAGNRERLRESMLKQGEDTYLERRLKERYGFTLRIPKAYKLDEERPEVPGISLVHPEPPRVLAVSWKAFGKATVSLADSNELYQIRSDVSFKLYEKYVMRRDLVKFGTTRLGAYEAVRMDGYWESSVMAAGGSFICYFIVDGVTSRLWLVDCLVYAPGQDKNELLRETMAFAETFAF